MAPPKTIGKYNDPNVSLQEIADIGLLTGKDFFGRVVPELAGMAYDRFGNIIGDATNTLLAGQPYSPSPRTAASMPINVDDDGVVDTYKYDEDMSAPPEYNNDRMFPANIFDSLPEVSVRPWVKDIGTSVSQTYNDILNRFTEPVEGSPTGETVLSIPLNTGTFPSNQSMSVDNIANPVEIPAYNAKAELIDAIDNETYFNSSRPNLGYGSEEFGPVVQEVGLHSLPPGARFGEGLVTSVPTNEVLNSAVKSKLTYPDRTPNPEVNTNLIDIGKGLLGGGTVGDMATGAMLGVPTSAAMKVAKDESLSPGERIGAGATAGAMTLASMLGGPAAGILGLLGGIFNSMGAYQDPSQVTGNISMSKGGTLSGDMDPSTSGGGFYQSGSLKNFNFFDDLAATNPNAIVDYKGFETNAAGARNLSGLEHYYGSEMTEDAISAGDATGGWGDVDDPGMTADNSGWG